VRNPLDLNHRIPWTQGVHGNSRPTRGKAQGNSVSEKRYRDLEKPISLEEAKTSLQGLRNSSKSEASRSSRGRTSFECWIMMEDPIDHLI
jgi:hypothetical protein